MKFSNFDAFSGLLSDLNVVGFKTSKNIKINGLELATIIAGKISEGFLRIADFETTPSDSPDVEIYMVLKVGEYDEFGIIITEDDLLPGYCFIKKIDGVWTKITVPSSESVVVPDRDYIYKPKLEVVGVDTKLIPSMSFSGSVGELAGFSSKTSDAYSLARFAKPVSLDSFLTLSGLIRKDGASISSGESAILYAYGSKTELSGNLLSTNGSSIPYSSTIGKEYIYVAIRNELLESTYDYSNLLLKSNYSNKTLLKLWALNH